jgi:hypothetical protein
MLSLATAAWTTAALADVNSCWSTGGVPGLGITAPELPLLMAATMATPTTAATTTPCETPPMAALVAADAPGLAVCACEVICAVANKVAKTTEVSCGLNMENSLNKL